MFGMFSECSVCSLNVRYVLGMFGMFSECSVCSVLLDLLGDGMTLVPLFHKMVNMALLILVLIGSGRGNTVILMSTARPSIESLRFAHCSSFLSAFSTFSFHCCCWLFPIFAPSTSIFSVFHLIDTGPCVLPGVVSYVDFFGFFHV